MSYAKARAAKKKLKLFLLYAGWCTSQKFLDLELVQFCPKRKVSNYIVLFYIFLWGKSYLHTGINGNIYFFIVFVGLNVKCKHFIFVFFYVSDKFMLFLQLLLLCIYHFLSMLPSETMD